MSSSLIGLLAYLVYTGDISIGELMSLYFYSFFVFGQLSLFGTVVKNYQEAHANHDILQEIMSKEPEAIDTHLPIIDRVDTIHLDDVSFGYNPDRLVIQHINANWTAGQTIAFV